MLRRQRLLLEHVKRRTGDLAGVQRRHQIVQLRRHAAADVDEERTALHALEARAVHEALGGRRMRHRQDDEVRPRQQCIERLRLVQFRNTGRRRCAPRVGRQHRHAERRGQPRGLRADAADTDDQRGRLRQMHDTAVLARLLPLAAELLRDEHVQPAGEGQHESHDVRADVVVEDFAKVGDRQRMLDQLGIVVSRGRCDLRCLQPAQPPRLRQHLAWQPAERCLGIDDLALRRRLIFGNYHPHFRHCLGQRAAPATRYVRLRRQHDELECVGT